MFARLCLYLRLKWLHLRWAYPYHWAHKPRCDRFRGEVFRLGHVHLCRSCTCVYAALAVAAVFSVCFYSKIAPWSVPAFLTSAGTTLLISIPIWYKRWPRAVRDLARAGLGLTLVLGVVCLIAGHFLVALAGAAALILFWRLYFRLRRGRKARECDDCPDLRPGRVCPGYAYQADRIRRYEEAATEVVADSYRPKAR